MVPPDRDLPQAEIERRHHVVLRTWKRMMEEFNRIEWEMLRELGDEEMAIAGQGDIALTTDGVMLAYLVSEAYRRLGRLRAHSQPVSVAEKMLKETTAHAKHIVGMTLTTIHASDAAAKGIRIPGGD